MRFCDGRPTTWSAAPFLGRLVFSKRSICLRLRYAPKKAFPPRTTLPGQGAPNLRRLHRSPSLRRLRILCCQPLFRLLALTGLGKLPSQSDRRVHPQRLAGPKLTKNPPRSGDAVNRVVGKDAHPSHFYFTRNRPLAKSSETSFWYPTIRLAKSRSR
jgi:hypothetical protein